MRSLPPGVGSEAGVAGMGRSGAAAARLLSSRGYAVKGFDSSPDSVRPEHVGVLVKGAPAPDDMKDLALLVTSPGVPPSSPPVAIARRLGIPVVPEVELGWACTFADSVGVTGSNGKTTTVEWLGHVLSRAPGSRGAVVAGNTGYALSDAVIDNPGCPVFCIELSSYQLETIVDLRVSTAAVLNLTPDHLTRHGSMENYGRAKSRIFMNQLEGDTAVLNMDDPLLSPMKGLVRGRLLEFSLVDEVPEGAWLDDSGMIRFRDGRRETHVLHSDRLGIPGMHNVANALAVVCMAFSRGVPAEILEESLVTFKGVPHRIENIGMKAGLRWVNDSKSTNVDSLRVALESFRERVILLAGGLAKDSDYSVLRELLGTRVKSVILFGSAAASLEEQWRGAADIRLAEDLQGAVDTAVSVAKPGDTVLLSPGCASFDQYRDFEARGEHFRRIVGGL